METLASQKRSSGYTLECHRFNNPMLEWKFAKQSIPSRFKNFSTARNTPRSVVVMSKDSQLGLIGGNNTDYGSGEFQGRKLFDGYESDEDGIRPLSSYSSDIDDDNGSESDDEVSSGFKGETLEQKFMNLQQEWDSMKRSIPRRFSNHNTERMIQDSKSSVGDSTREKNRKARLNSGEFQGRRLIDEFETDSDDVADDHVVSYLSYSFSVDNEVESSLSVSPAGLKIKTDSSKGGRATKRQNLMTVCVIISLILFGFKAMSSFGVVGHPRFDCNEFLVPT